MAYLLLLLSLVSPCLTSLQEDRLARELEDCRKQVELQEDQSYLGRVCSRLVSKDTQFKTSLEKILRHLDVLEGGAEGVEQELVLSLGQEDVRKLRKFVLVDQGSVGEVEDILVRSLRVRQPWLPSLQTSSSFLQSNLFLLGQLMVLLCCLVLPLILGAPKWQIFIFLVFYAVLQTWARLYYTACARKAATLSKHQANSGCLLEKQGWVAGAVDFVGGLFNGVEDPCEAYYTAVMVDPALEVGLVTAIVETFSVCLVVPGRACGEGLGSFYSHLLAPVPFMWKVPILLLATAVLLLLLLLLCGYEFRIPFLLTVRPAQRTGGEENRAWVTIGREGGGREAPACPGEEPGLSLPYPRERNIIDDLVEGRGGVRERQVTT